jgi:hypothetical protein
MKTKDEIKALVGHRCRLWWPGVARDYFGTVEERLVHQQPSQDTRIVFNWELSGRWPSPVEELLLEGMEINVADL